jgi:hypothetical protein
MQGQSGNETVVIFLKLTINELSIRPFLFLLRFASNSVEAFCASETNERTYGSRASPLAWQGCRRHPAGWERCVCARVLGYGLGRPCAKRCSSRLTRHLVATLIR